MTAKRRRTPADYESAAADYEAHPPTAAEIRSIEIGPALIKMGRPAKGSEPKGKTPALSVRFPLPIRNELDRRVDNGESDSAADLVRVAVAEYFENHPAEA